MTIRKLGRARPIKSLAIAALFFPFSGAMAMTYYVDSVAGSDANAGTSSAAPWATITKVNGISFSPGDQVLFKRGSTWTGTLIPGGQGTAGNPIVFDAYGTGAAPHISGGGSAAAVHIWNKMHLTFQNFEITNDAASDSTRCGIKLSYSSLTYPVYSGVKILNNEIHHVRGISNREAGIYNNAAIYVDMIASTRVDGMLIEGNDIHDITCIGIYIKPGPYFNIHPEVWATDMIIRDNLIDKTGADHIVVGGANAPLIENNAGYDGGINGAGYGWIAGMWSGYQCKDAVFQYNEVARMHNERAPDDGDSQAFDCDLGAVGTQIFQYNYSHDNKGGVLIMMHENVAKTVIFRYNISVNDDRQTGSLSQLSIFPILGVNSVHIYNNVFHTTLASGYMIRNTQATYIYNNIFDTPYAEYASRPWYFNNCYYNHSNTPTDPYKITADPGFVGPLTSLDGSDTVGGYQLKPNSPLINAGATVEDNGGLDYWGNALYSGEFADIGAHEVVGGGALPPAPVTIIDAAPSASIVYTGAWTHAADANYQESTKSVSGTIGNYVEYTFSGTNVALYGPKDTGIGKLNISIDGGPATLVDCYVASGGGVRKELFKVTGLSPTGTHKIRATVALKNPASATNNIGIDYFQIDPPARVTVDNPASAAVTYSGSWTHSADANYYNSTKSVSSTVGNYVEFTFTGSGASLYMKKDTGIGKLSITVGNGPPVVVDGYATSAYYKVPVFQISGLTPGTHTIRATIATKNPLSSGNNIGIDSFRYQP